MTDAAIKCNDEAPLTSPGEPPALAESRVQAIENELVRLSVHINSFTYKMLCLIRELDEHNAAQNMGFCSTAHFLHWRIGLDLGAAREKVRVARALVSLPKTSQALQKGTISYAKVRAITRIATAETEEALLNIAENGTSTHVEKVVRLYRRATGGDVELDERRYEGRYLHMHHDEDGMLVIEARLSPEEGAIFVKALEAAQEVDWKRDSDVSTETSDTPSQRRADALSLLARAALGSGLGKEYVGADGPKAPAIDPSRFEVVVHVDAERLKTPEAPGRCEIDQGSDVSVETLKRISCDSGLLVMTHDEKGNVLDVGRKTRVIPTAMRRALAHRDHGCQFPGCDRTRFVDAHHVQHWAMGGETKLENLTLLCVRHHALAHRGAYTLRRDQDGSLEFITPNGRVLPRSPALVPADDQAFSADWLAAQEKAATAVDMTVWGGEKMDYGWVIDELAMQKCCQKEHESLEFR